MRIQGQRVYCPKKAHKAVLHPGQCNRFRAQDGGCHADRGKDDGGHAPHARVGRHKPSLAVRHANNSNCIHALMLRAMGIAAMPTAPNNEIANAMFMPTPISVRVIGVRIILRP